MRLSDVMKNFQGYYLYRYAKWRLGYRSPISAILKITSKCNLKCRHCVWRTRKKKDIATKEWFRLIKMAKDKGCINCIIEGGEPLLRKDINQIVNYAKNLDLWTVVITNGTLDLSRCKPDVFWISVDGIGKVHDKIRGKDTFKRIVRNLKTSKENKITVTTISKINSNDIENICRFLSPFVNGMGFNFMYPYTDVSKLVLSRNERRKAAKKLIQLKKKYNIINSDSYLKAVGRRWDCKPWLTLNIDSDGSIHHGCTVEQTESCNCTDCDMACYGELSQAFGLKR